MHAATVLGFQTTITPSTAPTQKCPRQLGPLSLNPDLRPVQLVPFEAGVCSAGRHRPLSQSAFCNGPNFRSCHPFQLQTGVDRPCRPNSTYCTTPTLHRRLSAIETLRAGACTPPGGRGYRRHRSRLRTSSSSWGRPRTEHRRRPRRTPEQRQGVPMAAGGVSQRGPRASAHCSNITHPLTGLAASALLRSPADFIQGQAYALTPSAEIMLPVDNNGLRASFGN